MSIAVAAGMPPAAAEPPPWVTTPEFADCMTWAEPLGLDAHGRAVYGADEEGLCLTDPAALCMTEDSTLRDARIGRGRESCVARPMPESEVEPFNLAAYESCLRETRPAARAGERMAFGRQCQSKPG